MFSGLAHTLAGEHVHLPGRLVLLHQAGAVRSLRWQSAPGIIRFQMAVWKSAPALACGNGLVFKPARSPPARWAPCSCAEIYAAEAGLPAGLFSVVQGGPDTGRALVKHPDIAKVSFTGGAVAEAAGRLIRPVTLELGGKSPLIIFADADLDEAVRGAVLANYLCQGQVCSNAARVFVERRILDDFVDRLLRAVAGLRPARRAGPGLHRLRRGRGRQAAVRGDRVEVPGLETGHFLRPCVLANCSDGMRAVREEIFGAVLTLLEFDTEAEAVARANATEFGLSGGVFTRAGPGRGPTGHRRACRRASLYINTYNSYPPGVPFGGYKMSGFGRENCAESLRSYSQVKSVYVECAGIQLPTTTAGARIIVNVSESGSEQSGPVNKIFGRGWGGLPRKETSRKTRVPPLLHNVRSRRGNGGRLLPTAVSLACETCPGPVPCLRCSSNFITLILMRRSHNQPAAATAERNLFTQTKYE
uniref:Aldedh domain-containing protein n=1 Tax=Macrostomum lignano TaxID=282301 RepID=A0A1I8FNW2_9PLAT